MSQTTPTQNPTSKPITQHTDSQADFKLWSDFIGRSQRVRSASSGSEAPARASIEDENGNVDEILASYRSKEAARMKSNSSNVERPETVPGWKTEHGEPVRTVFNRVGGILGNLMDGKGWRRT